LRSPTTTFRRRHLCVIPEGAKALQQERLGIGKPALRDQYATKPAHRIEPLPRDSPPLEHEPLPHRQAFAEHALGVARTLKLFQHQPPAHPGCSRHRMVAPRQTAAHVKRRSA